MSSYDYKLAAALAVADIENYVNPEDPKIMSEMTEKNTPEKLCLWKEKMMGVGEEALQVIHIILNAPQELLDLIPDSKESISPNKLQEYLRNMGWERHQILKAYRNIKKMLREE